MDQVFTKRDTGERRAEACAALLVRARAIIDADWSGQDALEKIKGLLVGLANQGETLFPRSDSEMLAVRQQSQGMRGTGSTGEPMTRWRIMPSMQRK